MIPLFAPHEALVEVAECETEVGSVIVIEFIIDTQPFASCTDISYVPIDNPVEVKGLVPAI